MTHGQRFLFCVVGVLLVACGEEPREVTEWRASDHAHPAGAPDPARVARQVPGTPAAPTTPGTEEGDPDERAAAALWQVTCASCHGATGRGDGPRRAPVMRLPNFRDPEWQGARTDAQLTSVIALGSGMMPAFRDRIPPDGIALLVARIRSFAPTVEPEEDSGAQGVDGDPDDEAPQAPSPDAAQNGEGAVAPAGTATPPPARAAEPEGGVEDDPATAPEPAAP